VLRRAYQRLFVERILTINQRLDTVIGEVASLRAEIGEREEALEHHVQTVIAGQWETAALASRLAALEDRLEEV